VSPELERLLRGAVGDPLTVANEFAEATGDLYQGALIELGLVLFALTIIINGAARILVAGTTKKGTS